MPVVTSRSEWPVLKQGGDLVSVPVPGKPGVSVKMLREDAIRQGLLKMEEPANNKKRTAKQTK